MNRHYTRSDVISFPTPQIPNFTTHNSVPSTVDRQNSEVLQVGRGHHAVTEHQPFSTIHTYNLKEYAFVSINSHASYGQDVPLVYGEEETTGSVVFPEYRLREVRRIVVIVSASCSWLLRLNGSSH